MSRSLRILLLGALLTGCAHAADDAPRATLDPQQSHYAPGLGKPSNEAMIDPVIQRQGPRTCAGPCPEAKPADCTLACGAGEFCDAAGGVERCVKDVIPASATPGK